MLLWILYFAIHYTPLVSQVIFTLRLIFFHSPYRLPCIHSSIAFVLLFNSSLDLIALLASFFIFIFEGSHYYFLFMFRRLDDLIELLSNLDSSSSSSSSTSSLNNHFAEVTLQFVKPIQTIMVHQSHDENSVRWMHLIDVAPSELKWIHLDVKMVIASTKW